MNTKKIAVALGIAGLGGIVLASQALLLVRIWDPQWNPYRPSFQQILEGAKRADPNIASAKIDVNGEFRMKQEGREFFVVNAGMEGSLTELGASAQKFQGNLDVEFSAEGVAFSGAGEVVIADQENIYLKITKLPILPILGINGDELKNQWIRVPMGGAEGSNALTIEQQTHLLNEMANLFYDRAKAYSVRELPDEKVQGKKTYHYRLTITGLNLADLIQDAYDQAGLQERMDEDLSRALETVRAMGDTDIDLWLGNRDFYPYRLAVEKELSAKIFEATAKETDTVYTKMIMEIWDYNKPVMEIAIPTGAQTFVEILMNRVPEPRTTPLD